MMSSRGKKKTTMTKLNREARLRERRAEKVARKVARRDAAAITAQQGVSLAEGDDNPQQDVSLAEGDDSPQWDVSPAEGDDSPQQPE
jgi:alpha-D-ribose 1-methylphosphonate 5-triphosphate diphosphatase PhnM